MFPFFLFVTGVSVALMILPRLKQGAEPASLSRAALWRVLRIPFFGRGDPPSGGVADAACSSALPDCAAAYRDLLRRSGAFLDLRTITHAVAGIVLLLAGYCVTNSFRTTLLSAPAEKHPDE